MFVYVVCGFFFCFKQDTAYGLGINYWSSDVCLSGLAAQLRLCDIGDKGDGDTIGDGVEGPLDVRIAGLIGRHVQTAFHARQVEVPLEPGLDILDGLGVILQLETRRAGFQAAIRSEEHTSELQSLMRISYAVFCLKNKNNTR